MKMKIKFVIGQWIKIQACSYKIGIISREKM